MDVPPFVYPTVPSVDGHSGLLLFIVRNAAMDIPVKDRVDIRFHFSGIDTQEWNRQLEVSPLSCLFTMATAPFQSHHSSTSSPTLAIA